MVSCMLTRHHSCSSFRGYADNGVRALAKLEHGHKDTK